MHAWGARNSIPELLKQRCIGQGTSLHLLWQMLNLFCRPPARGRDWSHKKSEGLAKKQVARRELFGPNLGDNLI